MRRVLMETLAFWAFALSFFLFFEITTERERRKWFYDFITAVALVGATGFLWELISPLL